MIWNTYELWKDLQLINTSIISHIYFFNENTNSTVLASFSYITQYYQP